MRRGSSGREDRKGLGEGMIAVSGDTHGDTDFWKLGNPALRSVLGGDLPQFLIICGDFGVPWSNNPDDEQDNYLRKWYEDKPYEIIVCPGNHENYDRIALMPEEIYHGGRVRRYAKNIVMVERNQVLDIEGSLFYFFGGANSIDKMYRQPNVSWWPQELSTYADDAEMREVLKAIKSVDYVISHTCPESQISNFTHDMAKLYDADPTRGSLQYLLEKLNFTHWYFGHFHRDKDESKFSCLYNIVRKIG